MLEPAAKDTRKATTVTMTVRRMVKWERVLI
jgi:hypothetical protein